MAYLTAEPDPTRSIGYARVIIGGGGRLPPSLQFRIWREGYPTPNLGPRGWQVTEERLTPVAVEVEGDNTVLIVSPAVTRHLDVEPYVLAIPDAGIEAPIFWPDTIDIFDGPLSPAMEPVAEPVVAPPPSSAASRPPPVPDPDDTVMLHRPPAYGTAGSVDDTVVMRRPAVEPPAPNPAPAPPPPVTRSKVPALLGGLALLLVAGAGAWWFTSRHAPEPAQPAAAPPPTAAPGPVATAPQPPAPAPTPAPQPWVERTDGLAVRDVVGQAPDAAAIYEAARRRQAAGRYDDALVLFEEAADRGHAPAMTALGRMYDPNGFVAGRPFSAPDPRSAARYYQQAVRAGDTAAEPPRAALHFTMETLSNSGNSSAASALREFWP